LNYKLVKSKDPKKQNLPILKKINYHSTIIHRQNIYGRVLNETEKQKTWNDIHN
jgi:hypothetical protein